MVLEIISSEEISFAIKLVLAVIFGFLIGVERESRNKPAGISTHSFVIAGSMVFAYLSYNIGAGDPARIAAQIVTGIGFIGAGMILKGNNGTVVNLTTAASIWLAAAIGMAIGFGFYFVAALCTVASIFIPRIPHIKYKKKKVYK
ncbi:MgtC/SapB family protein [Candidatus Pacearchaeota archaeon]|nr:MgtC/SapB family protein [Candidatus Pacearchaeota archaeon]